MSLIISKLKENVTDIRIKISYSGTKAVLAGYDYQLKSGNTNAPIEERQGDNLNSQDDVYSLPTPILDNVGRKVVLTSKIAALDNDSDYEVNMSVLQDGQVTDTLVSNGHVSTNGEAALSFDIIKFE